MPSFNSYHRAHSKKYPVVPEPTQTMKINGVEHRRHIYLHVVTGAFFFKDSKIYIVENTEPSVNDSRKPSFQHPGKQNYTITSHLGKLSCK